MGCGKSNDKVKPTAQETALAEISKKQLRRYEHVFAPLEDKWLKDSRISAGEKERLRGHIAGDVTQAASARKGSFKGMNPSSGNFTAGMRDLAVGKGKATSKALADGNMQAENADVTALMSGVRLGRGQAVEAQSGMSSMADMATSKAISDAFVDRANSNATADLVGSGLGVAAYGMSKFKTPSGGQTSSGTQVSGTKAGGIAMNYSLNDRPLYNPSMQMTA